MKFFQTLTGIDFDKITRLQRAILFGLLLISVFNFFMSMNDSFQYGGVDLRNKVVGSRYFWQGINPYSIVLNPPTDDRLLDPIRRYPGPSRATVAPLVLAFYGILAWLPYKVQRIAWALFEWMAMFASIFLLNKTIRSHKSKFIFLCISLLFFVSGYFWRLHVERGQYYIFLTLILSIGIYLDLKYAGTKFAGIPFGLAAMFRLTYSMLFIFFILFKKYRTVLVMLITAILCFIFTSSLIGVESWRTYADNVREIESVLINKNTLNQQYGPMKKASDTVEGVNIRAMMDGKNLNETFIGTLIILRDKFNINFPLDWHYTNIFLTIIVILSSIILTYYFDKQKLGGRLILLFSLVMIINLDFFVPERYSYVDVLFLPLIALIIPYCTYYYGLSLFTVIFLIAFAGNQFIFGFEGAKGNLLRYLLFMGSLNILCLSIMLKRTQLKHKKTEINTGKSEKC